MLEELFPKLCSQVLLIGEQHTGQSFTSKKDALKYIEDNLGVFLTVMAASVEAELPLIPAITHLRDQWLSTSENKKIAVEQ